MSESNTPDIMIARCGLCCSNCGMYLKKKCPGCHGEKPMNRNCPTRACAIERAFSTCAECPDFKDLRKCKKLHNFFSRLFGFIFRSDRMGNLNAIREIGLEAFKGKKRADGRI